MNPVAILRKSKDPFKDQEGEVLYVWCPACDDLHGLPVRGTLEPKWDWDGMMNSPTLTPSILTTRSDGYRCHSYLQGGVWRYLDDCTHLLAGRSAPMTPLPDWVVRDTNERNEDGDRHEQ